MKLFDYLDKSDQKLPVLVNLVTPQGPEGWIYKQTGKVDRYASLIRTKSPTKWDTQLTESNFQTHPSILFFEYRGVPWLWEDTVIRGLDYVSGAYVNADKSMYPLADVRSVSILIQSQQCRDFEMIFEGVTALNLRPAVDKYTADIYDASLFVRDASVFFSDSCLEKPDTSYEGTWITAYGLRWRFT